MLGYSLLMMEHKTLSLSEYLSEYCFVFDIDGTLIDLQMLWRQTYLQLYRQEYGFTLTAKELSFLFGPPEVAAHTLVLKSRGIYTHSRARKLAQQAQALMIKRVDVAGLEKGILPGVKKMLHYLEKKNAALLCYTGNLPHIAKAILQKSGLHHFFPLVACAGFMTHSKYDTMKHVLRWLSSRHRQIPAHHIVVVGDTPFDIQVAKHLGMKCIAAGTGRYTLTQLRKEKYGVVVKDLKGWREVLVRVTTF